MTKTNFAEMSPMMVKRTIEITLEDRGIDADQLGQLKARISDLDDIAETIKSRLIETASEPVFGTRAFEGQLFRAVVSFEDKTNTNWSALIKDLFNNADAKLRAQISALIIKHTKTAESVPVVRTYARKA